MSESTWNDPRITAYALDELSAEDRAAFELELESNAELMAAVEEARSVTGQLAGLYAGESTPPLDSKRRESILAAQSVTLANPPNGRSWGMPLMLLAVAAVVLLLIGITPWLNQHSTDLTVTQLPPQPLENEPLENEPLVTTWENPSMEGNELLRESLAVESVNAEALASAAQPNAQPTADGSTSRNLVEVEPEAQGISIAGRPAMQRGTSAGEQEKSSSRLKFAQQVGSNPQVTNGAARSPSPSLRAAADASLAQPVDRQSVRGQQPAAIQPDRSRSQANREQIDSSTATIETAKSLQQESIKLRYTQADNQPPMPVASSGESKPQSVDATDDGIGVIGDTQIQFVPELGTIIVRGNKRDVQRVEKVIKEIDAKGMDSGTPLARSATPTLSKLPIAGTPRFEGLTAGFGIQKEFGRAIDEGRGPGISGDQFEPITDNAFKRVSEHPLSTFSVDVDTASYSKVRDFLMRANQLPRVDAVRIEELVNYFDYDYPPPASDAKHPFAAQAVITSCPWNKEHRLARIALKGKTMDKGQRPPCNLVFLLDTSGSMDAPNKLPLVIEGMKMLLDQLRPQDQVAITVYAGSAGLVLDSTSAKKAKKIRNALTQLAAGGSTNGGAGISLAYQTARDNFITDGVNRVILCTDGDFNVGTTGTDELVRMVETEAKGGIYLSVLGFGMGNHNDAMLEKISGRGNGNYAFIDTRNEARKVLVDQTSGTLVTIAKNVKMQVEFNPAHVASYRLIGYENRILAKEDFNDDKKDAGEIGAGHSVTALYELVPVDLEADAAGPEVDDLKYQTKPEQTEAADSDETMTLKLRYLAPDAIVENGDESTLVEIPVSDEGGEFEDADSEFRFAAAVAGFGMKLRRSPYAGTWTLSDVLKVAESSAGKDKYELRAEFADLVRKASQLMGEE